MKTQKEIRKLISDMSARFERDVQPLINTGLYVNAAMDLEVIINILKPNKKQIEELPSGINYLISLNFIYKALASNQKPAKERMQEYRAYSAQVTMQRAD